MRVAMALKARTGRALVVAVGDAAGAACVVERAELRLLPAGATAPYHAAEGLGQAAARAAVARAVAAAHALAAHGIEAAVRRLDAAGHTLAGCAVLVGAGMPDWSVEEILAVHVRMHQAEGELFRAVLVAGAGAAGLGLTTLPEKTALDAAAGRLGVSRARLDAELARLGKAAGPPWTRDQKEAAAAALVALRAAP